MLDWIVQNLANIVICLVLILAVTLAAVKLVRDKKAADPPAAAAAQAARRTERAAAGSSKKNGGRVCVRRFFV